MMKAALLLCLLAFCAGAATSGTPLHDWEKPSFCKERDCTRFETVSRLCQARQRALGATTVRPAQVQWSSLCRPRADATVLPLHSHLSLRRVMPGRRFSLAMSEPAAPASAAVDFQPLPLCKPPAHPTLLLPAGGQGQGLRDPQVRPAPALRPPPACPAHVWVPACLLDGAGCACAPSQAAAPLQRSSRMPLCPNCPCLTQV